MKLKQLGSNQTEIQLDNGNFLILVSYETPVASYHVKDNQFTKTNKKWSKTTTKHINNWIRDITFQYTGSEFAPITDVDQEVINALMTHNEVL